MLALLSTITVQLSALLVSVFMLQWLLRHQSARVQYQLWQWSIIGVLALVVVSIMPPLTITLPTASSTELTINRINYPTSPIYQVNPILPQTGSVSDPTALDTTSQSQPADTPVTVSALDVKPINWQQIAVISILCIWGIRTLTIFGRYLFSMRRMRTIVKQSRPISADWHTTLADICQQLSIVQPKIKQSDQVPVPMVVGSLSPTILIAADMVDATPEQRHIVLYHECVHIQRRDILLHACLMLIVAFQWFNPLVWVTRRQVQMRCEQSCDERLLERGTDQETYAQYLVDTARLILQRSSSPAIMMPFAAKPQLTERVHRILNHTPQRSSRVWQALRVIAIVLFGVVVLGQLHLTLQAQSPTVLTLALPDFMESNRDAINSAVADFEAQNPNVQVQVVTVPIIFGSTADAQSTNDYLAAIRNRAQSGDVLMVESISLNPAATRAGLFLDLDASIRGDRAFNPDAYRAAAWDAFQWDNGIWAMPASVSPIGLLYDEDAFDSAGLPFPSASYSLRDLERAAITLTGDSAGLQVNNSAGYLAVTLSGTSLTDDNLPALPDLTKTEVASVAESFGNLYQEGALAQFSPESERQFLLGTWAFATVARAGNPLTMAPLPDGRVGVEARGYAVSAGTPHPQLAYELATFLSERPDVLSIFRELPASLSADIPPSFRLTESDISTLETLLSAYIPAEEVLFADAFDHAVVAISNGASVDTALQDTSSNLAEALTALPTYTSAEIVLATPVPQTVQEVNASGETLTFAMDASTNNINLETWQAELNRFAENDPDIGRIEINFLQETGVDDNDIRDQAVLADCGYIRYIVNYSNYLDQFLDLRPLIASDFTFNPDDLVADGLAATTREDGTVFMLPASIEPYIFAYNAALFERNNVPIPTRDWTVSDLTTIIADFEQSPDYDDVVLAPQVFSTDPSHITWLIALFGGHLLDPNGVGLMLDDVDTQRAVRQILGLAQQGSLEYIPLFAFQQDFRVQRVPPLITTALTDQTLNEDGVSVNSGVLGTNTVGTQPYTILPAPQGVNGMPYAYDVTGLYITQITEFPDACFRLIRFLQEQPILFAGVPVYERLLDDSAVTSITPQPLLDFYADWIDQVQQPNAQRIRTLSGVSFADYTFERIVARAFDRIVLEGAPIDAELSLAQDISDDLVMCADDADLSDDMLAGEVLQNCLDGIDPTLFGGSP